MDPTQLLASIDTSQLLGGVDASQLLGGGMDTSQLLVEFVHKWGLDGRSQQLLEGLPAEVQQAVFKGFSPPAGTRSADAVLNAFVRRVSADMGHSGGGGGGRQWAEAAANGGNTEGLDPLIAQFIAQWGLDDVSEQLLRSQSPDYIREVTQSFQPPPDTRNMSARFCTFLRGGSGFRAQGPSSGAVAQPGADEAAIQAFVGQWGLDDQSRQILRKLSYEAFQGVIADFNPPADTQNINARFMTFVRSRDKGGFGASGRAPLTVPSLGGGWRQAQDSLKSFVVKWGFDEQSEAMLRQLQPAQLLNVIHEFSPPAGTHNINARLNAFVKSVLQSSPAGGSQDPVAAFVRNWSLDDDAYQALRALPANARDAVMREFNPPPGTVNASGRLKAFIRHRAANEGFGDSGQGELSGGGGGGGGLKRSWPTFSTGEVQTFVEKWRLDESAEHTLLGLPEDVLADVLREFNPPPGTWNPSGRLNAFVRTRMERDSVPNPSGYGAAAGGVSDDPIIRAFVDRWGLDGKSEEMLRGLSQDLLSIVISGFEPDATTRNRNAKLSSWIRFLQTSQSGGDSKRPRY